MAAVGRQRYFIGRVELHVGEVGGEVEWKDRKESRCQKAMSQHGLPACFYF